MSLYARSRDPSGLTKCQTAQTAFSYFAMNVQLPPTGTTSPVGFLVTTGGCGSSVGSGVGVDEGDALGEGFAEGFGVEVGFGVSVGVGEGVGSGAGVEKMITVGVGSGVGDGEDEAPRFLCFGPHALRMRMTSPRQSRMSSFFFILVPRDEYLQMVYYTRFLRLTTETICLCLQQK